MDLAKLSSKVGRSVGRSVDKSFCLSGLVFLFCVVDRPGFLFLGFLESWLMERFSLEVLVCGVVASCLSLFGFSGFFLGLLFGGGGVKVES